LIIELPIDPAELPACLTETECKVVTLVLEGRSNQEIADARGARYRTVANQLASIYKKLGIASRTELVATLSGSAEVAGLEATTGDTVAGADLARVSPLASAHVIPSGSYRFPKAARTSE
jgi:DNA-binding CsgD family transcriptional regulator